MPQRANNQILTVAQMVAAEDVLIARGSSVDALMQIAGQGAAQWVWRICGGRSVTVLCGPGNNGGDGYVIAEYLRAQGAEVRVIAPLEPKTDAARNARSAYAGDVQTAGELRGDVFVDALFGSGLSRPLSQQYIDLLGRLSEHHQHSVAIDMPSGVNSDAGTPLASGLPSYDVTLALGAWKYAHWSMPAAAMMGVRRLVPIGIGKVDDAAHLLSPPTLHAPRADAHKYSRGLAAVVGGAMPGAAILACSAAMHGGAGYVKLLAGSDLALAQVGLPHDLVMDTRPVEDALSDPRIRAVLVGPGLGRDGDALERLRYALALDCPTVLDADALMLLQPEMLEGRRAPILATPHAGELEKLSQSFAIEATGKRECALSLAAKSGMVVVAKGPDTLIATPDGRLTMAPPATSWLSVAGTGDVLAGLAVSRMAVGGDAFTAACEAVWLHAEAARLAGHAFTASDLCLYISKAFLEIL